jgi:hypothetical protein
MLRRSTPVRGQAKLAAAIGGWLLLFGAAAVALSVLLPPGVTLPVPATTAATEPTLDGVVEQDTLVPFTIKTAAGELICQGNLQDRVVRSTSTHQLDFYYAIRDTNGPGAVARILTASFAKLPLRVGYRTDGLGTVPPRKATRSAKPGAAVTFAFTDPPVSCAKNEWSRFILIRTPVMAFHTGGATRIIATTGAGVTLPTAQP